MFTNNEFYLMNKDIKILKFNIKENLVDAPSFDELHRYSSVVPIGYDNIDDWISQRQAPKHREYIANLLRECGCYNLDGYVRITHCLSLNDTFWVKSTDSPLKWRDVSLYTNEFDETIAKIAFEGGLYGKQFTTTSPEFGTSGAFAKCWVRKNDDIFLLKRGSSDSRNAGLEPYSEMYSSQIAKIICKDYVDYTLTMHHNKLASICPLFTSEKEGFVTIANALKHNSIKKYTVDEVLAFFKHYGLSDAYERMVVLDALIINTDRHMGNYGFIIDNDTMEIKRMAPIFDNNQALLPYAVEDDFINLDKYLESRPTRIGIDFNATAHALLTPSIKADLNNLRGFTFDTSGDYNLPPERLKVLEKVINSQIDKILNNIKLYVPKQASNIFS